VIYKIASEVGKNKNAAPEYEVPFSGAGTCSQYSKGLVACSGLDGKYAFIFTRCSGHKMNWQSGTLSVSASRTTHTYYISNHDNTKSNPSSP